LDGLHLTADGDTNMNKRIRVITDAFKCIIGMMFILYLMVTAAAIVDYGWIKGLGFGALLGGTGGAIFLSIYHDATK